jgi:hypothetical protein
MKLIPISDNVLVNPECITCVEQRMSRGVEVTYVWVGEKNYFLEVPLDQFYKSLGLGENHEYRQEFAG